MGSVRAFISSASFPLTTPFPPNSGIWILTGETFPTRTRSHQASLAAGSNWLWNFLLAFFTPFITRAIEFRYGFVFAACNLAGSVVVYLFLYESGGVVVGGG